MILFTSIPNNHLKAMWLGGKIGKKEEIVNGLNKELKLLCK